MSCWATLGALFLGLSLTIAGGHLYEGHSLGQPCVPGRPCMLAFISDNPVMLRCPHSYYKVDITWQYLDPSWTNERPVTFLHSGGPAWLARGPAWPLLSRAKLRRLCFKSRLVASSLYIPSPSVADSGLYTCRAGDATIAYYEVDFQDAGRLHVSHAGLGEPALSNDTVELGNRVQATLFTSWSPWQSCDRCGHAGERKRVGFCYAQLTVKGHQEEMPLPCGMARRKYLLLPQRAPELRVETCHVTCDASFLLGQEKPNWVPLLVLTTYHPQQRAITHLRCPTSSIYSPVYWQVGLTSLTHLELLQKNSSQNLDRATGGGILHLSFENESQNSLYQCFVNGRLVGRFFVASMDAVRPPEELAHTYSIIEALVVGLSIFLVFLMFLSIVQSCRRKPGTTMV